jgi:lysophospholipase L1-like esterase
VVLHRTALPPGSVLVNLGVPGATVADALAAQLPQALARRPALATVWLNVNDILRGVPPRAYERQLETLVSGLARGGATLVLVANTPALELLPVYQQRPLAVADVVDDYNDAIERVTRRAGAVLVDLHGAGSAALQAGTSGSLVSTDGFHPSTAGHRAVAELFAEALERAVDGPGPTGRASARS